MREQDSEQFRVPKVFLQLMGVKIAIHEWIASISENVTRKTK